MQITTQQFKKSVVGWLTEESATIEQALMLQSTLEAGAIAGEIYEGKRSTPFGSDYLDEIDEFQSRTGFVPGQGDNDEEELDEDYTRRECGCLVETFERIKHGRPSRMMGESTAQAFSLALMIGVGDTPANSKWARAAARGIEQYVAAQEAA